MSEFFDVLTEHGDFTNEVVSREECHERGLWHKAAVVFVVSMDNKRILLQQRAAGWRHRAVWRTDAAQSCCRPEEIWRKDPWYHAGDH